MRIVHDWQARAAKHLKIVSLVYPSCTLRDMSVVPGWQARAVKRLLGHRLDANDAEAARREWHDLVRSRQMASISS